MIPRQYLGRLADIPDGQGKTFLVGAKKVIVVHMDGVLKAFVSFCPHQGGSMRYDGRKLQCNWHGAEFDPKTGAAQTGPAAEGTFLDSVDLTIEDGAVYAHMKIKEKSPWADDF